MNVSRSARAAKSLAAEYYTSADIFRLESERVFGCYWLCVGRAAELSEPGRFARLQIDGESLILLRDEQFTIRCFFNVCRHRGTRLCERTGGDLGKTIVCPYHGWTYNLAGQLHAAPNMGDVEGFDLHAFRLKEVATECWGGFVFLNFTGDKPFPLGQAPLRKKFEPWSLAELVSVERRAYVVRANWKLLFQNYNECYHCPRLHPRLNSLSSYTTATNDLEQGLVLGGPMQLRQEADSMTASGAACAPYLPGLGGLEQRRVYYYSVFPTLLLSPHPDYVLVHRIERVQVDVTRVVCEFLFHPDAVSDPGFDPAPAVQFWDETNRQDWHVCELAQRGVSSRAYEPGPYANLESTVAAFDRHYLQLLGD